MPQDKEQGYLARAFIFAVFCLAIYQFSENTVDPDLWGHIYYGTQLVETGKPTEFDVNSWTANGLPSFDHEYLGEAVFAMAWLCLGGTGLLFLKVAVGLLTFDVALSTAAKNMDSKAKLIAWAFGALAVVEISFGFAARPQIFTALFLAIELWLLRRIHSGGWRWAFVLPPMFALWFNLHGGALVGLVLLFTAAGATSAQYLLAKAGLGKTDDPLLSPNAIPVLWISGFVCATTVVLNPHGFELARWLVGSVLWLRPQIQEWNPTPFSGDHSAFFLCAALTAAALVVSRLPRRLWEIAALAFLFLVGFRAVRNAPLFCIAALALVPPYLADAVKRGHHHLQRFQRMFSTARARGACLFLLMFVSAGIVVATLTLHKERFWTMEIPRRQYPVAATRFIEQHGLHGNLLVFFDWGEMCIWNLPNSKVSIDGRLDSVYPPDVIAAHWNLYNGRPFDTNALNLGKADFALLPSRLIGAQFLGERYGWTLVYFDDLAVVLVKNPRKYPELAGLKLPIKGPADATQGREAFPNRLPRQPVNSRL